jgi:glycosyltransferase involved in cell wall biosynthesis
VMIEAMACGTPVIAYNNGSVPEVLEDGVTGFIVKNEQQAVDAAAKIGVLDRDRIRAEFDRRFTAHHMAQNYLKLYARLAKAERTGKRANGHANVAHPKAGHANVEGSLLT